MTIFLILCLLLPVVLLVQGRIDRSRSRSDLGALSTRLIDWPSRKAVSQVLLLGIGIMVTVTTVSTIIDEKPFLFDDSFISYRYAKNLAAGHGLTWNPGESPSEGYTNLLLVLLVAPVIRFGGDPLLAVRAISLIAAVGMAIVVYRMARRDLRVEPVVAGVLAMGIFTFSTTVELTMLGLETVVFAAMMLVAYDLAEQFFETNRRRWMLASGAVSFVAFLLRPEIVFLPVAIVTAVVLLEFRDVQRLFRVVSLLAVSFGLPLVIYLAWKLWYFHSIWPNPAFVKMSGPGFVRPRGLNSIADFVGMHEKVILMAGIGLLFSRGRARSLLTCSLVVAAYILFFLRVDTLMDMHIRFLYPAFPFLLVIALPALGLLVDGVLGWQQAAPIRLVIGAILFIIIFYPNPGAAVRRLAGAPRADPVIDREIHRASTTLKRVGTELATYRAIADVTIGSTDAGLLPYTSGARHVDMAGLTTRYIAEHKDVQAAADYFFDQKPDLIILRAETGGALIDYEHGTLGNYPRWAHHPGWNNYRPIAGVHAGSRFDLYFFLRQDSSHRAALEQLIRERIADSGIAQFATVMGRPSP